MPTTRPTDAPTARYTTSEDQLTVLFFSMPVCEGSRQRERGLGFLWRGICTHRKLERSTRAGGNVRNVDEGCSVRAMVRVVAARRSDIYNGMQQKDTFGNAVMVQAKGRARTGCGGSVALVRHSITEAAWKLTKGWHCAIGALNGHWTWDSHLSSGYARAIQGKGMLG
jgi:hypothetical protein